MTACTDHVADHALISWLHGHVEAVQDVPAEHQRVYGSVDCMDPAWGGEGHGKKGSAAGPVVMPH